VVTQRNLLAVADYFGEEAAPCEAGKGCRGDVAVNSSGDVPTSVIFPYKDRVHVRSSNGECTCPLLSKKSYYNCAHVRCIEEWQNVQVHANS